MPDMNYTDKRGVYHSIQDDYDDYNEDDYDDEWYEDYPDDYYSEAKPTIRTRLKWWMDRLIQRIRLKVDRHYREHFGDIPF